MSAADKLLKQLTAIAMRELNLICISLPYTDRWLAGNRLYRCPNQHVTYDVRHTPDGTHFCKTPCDQRAFITFPKDMPGKLVHEGFSDRARSVGTADKLAALEAEITACAEASKDTLEDANRLLREQADRIAELENVIGPLEVQIERDERRIVELEALNTDSQLTIAGLKEKIRFMEAKLERETGEISF